MIIREKIFSTVIASSLMLSACGGSDSSQENVIAENIAPSIILNDMRVGETQLVTVTASVTDDTGIGSYQWRVSGEHSVVLSGSDSQTVSFNAPSVGLDGSVVSLGLIVIDEGGLSASAEMNVIVENIMPEASIEGVYLVTEKGSVTISPVVSSVGEISYNWSVVDSNDIVLSNPDAKDLVFNAPSVTSDTSVTLQLVISDNDGDNITLNTVVDISQIHTPLIITGVATDSPLSDADLSVFVGDRLALSDIFADINGNYTALLRIDDDDNADAMIKVVAMGVGDQLVAGLVSLLGSANVLIEQSGEDGVLTSSDNFNVNVTNMTTAYYALTKAENKGQEVENSDKLQKLGAVVNYNLLMKLATAIKVAIDKAPDNEDLNLPEGINNTLELISDLQLLLTYIADVELTKEFTEAQEEILTDENLVDQTVFSVPEVIYIASGGALSFSSPVMNFDSDGTGREGENVFEWSVNGNVVSAEFIAPFSGAELFHNVDTPEGAIQVSYINQPISFELTKVNSTETEIFFSKKTVFEKQYNADELERRGIFLDNVMHNVYVNSLGYIGGNEIVIEKLDFGTVYLPIPAFDERNELGSFNITSDAFTLNSNGKGHSAAMDYDINWSISDGMLDIEMIDSTGEITDVQYVKIVSDSGLDQFSFSVDGEPELSFSGKGEILAEPISWGMQDIPGIYGYPNSTSGNPLSHFWWELYEGGNADTISTNDENEDGIITEDEVYRMYGTWYVEEGNKLVITRVRNSLTSEYDSEHRLVDGDWKLFHARTWELASVDGEKFGLLHKHFFNIDGYYGNQVGTNSWNITNFDMRTITKLESRPVEIEQDNAVSSTSSFGLGVKALTLKRENVYVD
jgi:hypothetical protein